MHLKNWDTHFSFGNRNIVLEFVNRSAKSTFGQIHIRTHYIQQWHVCSCRSVKCVHTTTLNQMQRIQN